MDSIKRFFNWLRSLFEDKIIGLEPSPHYWNLPEVPRVYPITLDHAILVAVTKVDPAKYGGWEGHLPGTEKDLQRMVYLIASRTKGDVYVLADKPYVWLKKFPNVRYLGKATNEKYNTAWRNICDDAQGAFEETGKRQIIFNYHTGHGGQVQDTSGDEADGLDETMLLFDGEFVDDNMEKFYQALPEGTVIHRFADTCHSGTSARNGAPKVPTTICEVRTKKKGDDVTIIHVGGAADSEVAWETKDGGGFATLALWTVTNGLTKVLSAKDGWNMVIREIVKQSKGKQKPELVVLDDRDIRGVTFPFIV